MIANATPQPELPAVDAKHPDHDTTRELLACLSPKYAVSMRAIAATIGVKYDEMMPRVARLRRDGINISINYAGQDATLRVHRTSWPRVEADALDYWHRRYGGQR